MTNLVNSDERDITVLDHAAPHAGKDDELSKDDLDDVNGGGLPPIVIPYVTQ
jgi:hypothetical protein